MSTLDPLKYALVTTLFAVAACDDPRGPAVPDALDDVRPRCVGAGCTDPPLNSNILAGPLDNFPQYISVTAENPEGTLDVHSATLYHNNAWRDVDHWVVSNSGQLVIYYFDGDDLVKVSAEEVAGTIFEVEYTPDGQNSVSGQLTVLEVHCSANNYASLFFCTYTLATNIAPPSPDYPVLATDVVWGDWYATCPDDNNDGLLATGVKHDAVFNHNVYFDRNTPDITINDENDVIACLNAVVAKPPYYLNVFYDHLVDPHARALDSSQVMAIVYAFAAWWNGAPRTAPGHPVCFDDPIQGLFGGAQCPNSFAFEGAHNDLVGQVCRASNSSHRHMAPPPVTYVQSLPECTPQDYVNAAGSPTIGVWSVPATP